MKININKNNQIQICDIDCFIEIKAKNESIFICEVDSGNFEMSRPRRLKPDETDEDIRCFINLRKAIRIINKRDKNACFNNEDNGMTIGDVIEELCEDIVNHPEIVDTPLKVSKEYVEILNGGHVGRSGRYDYTINQIDQSIKKNKTTKKSEINYLTFGLNE